MTDPLDRLADLRPGDVPVPPASEIRARGDLLRRRRYAAAAGGAALAVALVLTPLAVLAQDGDRSAPAPAATTAPSPSTSAAADDLRPVLAAADLPAVPRPGVEGWREVAALDEALPTIDCVPTRGLVQDRPPTEWLVAQGFSLVGDSDLVLGRARVAAYRFTDEPAAAAAEQRAREALSTCPGLPDAYGDALVGLGAADVGVEGATGATREVVHSAPEVCAGDCDAAWFDHQAVVRLGDTLVLLSWAEVGGPMPPEGAAERFRAFLPLAVGAVAAPD